jgi:hypothetical protein
MVRESVWVVSQASIQSRARPVPLLMPYRADIPSDALNSQSRSTNPNIG